MDSDERYFHWLEVHDRRRTLRWNVITVLVSVGALIFSGGFGVYSIVEAQKQAIQNAKEARYTQAQANFNSLVEQLGSNNPVVQLLSIRRITQFVANGSNYDARTCNQFYAAGNLIQLIEATITRDAPMGDSGTLSKFSPQNVSDDVLRTIPELIQIENDAKGSFGPTDDCRGRDVYLANIDLDGSPLSGWKPKNGLAFSLLNSDFRDANLSKMDLRQVSPTSLKGSYFTCAKFKDANFGTASVGGADFTGANLTGADLSHTKIKQSQIRHATLDAHTKLPFPKPASTDTWTPQQCSDQMKKMTGMFPGQGYRTRVPCPASSAAWALAPADLVSRFPGSVTDLVSFCTARAA